MTLIDTLKRDQIATRKARDTIAANLLTTLVAEAAAVGKNNGNRESTDAEVVKKIKQFVSNTQETIRLVRGNIPDGPNKGILGGFHAQQLEKLNRELGILESYMPTQLTREQLEEKIRSVVADLPQGTNAVGAVMKALKESYEGLYDPKLASEIVKGL
jgi:uncharacterized protein YqeY